mmetsp:Transcript_44990/g.101617  ORF Transcript_44990/g.101617 Transcript_44990/m.101617 type:complete len:235 (-) Transcript_44990:136-840(-)
MLRQWPSALRAHIARRYDRRMARYPAPHYPLSVPMKQHTRFVTAGRPSVAHAERPGAAARVALGLAVVAAVVLCLDADRAWWHIRVVLPRLLSVLFGVGSTCLFGSMCVVHIYLPLCSPHDSVRVVTRPWPIWQCSPQFLRSPDHHASCEHHGHHLHSCTSSIDVTVELSRPGTHAPSWHTQTCVTKGTIVGRSETRGAGRQGGYCCVLSAVYQCMRNANWNRNVEMLLFVESY